MADHKELIEEYRRKKSEIRKRLDEFKEAGKLGAESLFTELCFCILTPQSNARQCDRAIQELKEKKLLFKAPAAAMRPVLKGKSRFHNKKAEYLVMARRSFDKSMLDGGNILDVRKRIVDSVKGIGYKEASHFLRNIGFGRDIAILDRHILKNLKRYGVIGRVPSSMSVKAYLDIEKDARVFAKKMGMGIAELDLLLWSRETGEIFK